MVTHAGMLACTTSRRSFPRHAPSRCLHPPQPDEYEKLGSYALIGLPDDLYPTRFVEVRHRLGALQGRPARESRRWQGARCRLGVCALWCASAADVCKHEARFQLLHTAWLS